MLQHDLLDAKRLYQLMRVQLALSAKTIWQTVAVITILTLLFTQDSALDSAYFFFLYSNGFVLTGRIFADMHQPEQASLFLTLPCSNLERFLCKWLLSSIGFAVGLWILYFLIAAFISASHFVMGTPVLPLLHASLWVGIGKYCILQSVVLLGAACFRSHALLKTALTLGCFFMVLSIFSFILAITLFWPSHLLQGVALVEASLRGSNFVFWVLLAPICWYLTYLRVTEYELT